MSVSRETRIEDYVALLTRWRGALNLTSSADAEPRGLRRHIDDSLAIVPHLPADVRRIIDLGSGQGFPAIPIAVETGSFIELVEADRRKAAFLSTVLATLSLGGKVHRSRIEHLSLEPASCVTARALAPLERLLPLARPFMRPDGYGLFLKGPSVLAEVAAAKSTMVFDYAVTPISSRSTLIKITGLR